MAVEKATFPQFKTSLHKSCKKQELLDKTQSQTSSVWGREGGNISQIALTSLMYRATESNLIKASLKF